MGSAIGSKLSYMRAMMARGGAQEIVEHVLIPSWKKFLITPNVQKTPPISHLLSPAEIQFHERCSIITQNIFAEHTNHQYIKGLAQKGRDLLPCSAPLFIQITTKGRMGNIIGFSCWGIVISAITIYSGLCLIRTAKKKHYKMIVKANELIIDTTAIDIN